MKNYKGIAFFIATTVMFFSLNLIASSTPDGVTVTPLGNSTSQISNGTSANYTGGSGLTSGGYIFTVNVSGNTQNTRWKAFVGNVSGKLTLDDSDGYTIYDWSLSTITGEVYATRQAGTINWTGIGCAPVNATETENAQLNHTSKDDNITATFGGTDNRLMSVGTVTISTNTCRTTNVYQNSTDTGSTSDVFEEVALYDNGNSSWDKNLTSFGNIVYAQNLENDRGGYNNATTYDFQLVVPERGLANWQSSTAYYLYIELS